MTLPRLHSLRTVGVVLAAAQLSGCFALIETPVPPTPTEREELAVRGVVVGGATDGSAGERVEFDDIQSVSWTADALSIVGVPKGAAGTGAIAERRFPLSTLSAVLVRKVNSARTSAVIGGMIVGVSAIIMFLVTGKAEQYGTLGG
jgi:hypothetical protein